MMMIAIEPFLLTALTGAFLAMQALYVLALMVDFYFFSLPVNLVRIEEARVLPPSSFPYIVLFYPVLRESEAQMRATLNSFDNMDYPASKSCVVAAANSDDVTTLASLRRLQLDFPLLQIVEVPPTGDASWQVVWDSWEETGKAYWWHRGRRAGNCDLPATRTRQLIYAFYSTLARFESKGDFLVHCIDAESSPPADHFLAAAVGIRHYDVLQAQNIPTNLNYSMASTWHAFDHMAWDGMRYPHMSADGRQPFWVLGKGLFLKASDLAALGGFNPWIGIEEPEIGMRLWVNGKRLGIIKNPLVKEVPSKIGQGVRQRKRWVAGSLQSLGEPLGLMGMTRPQQIKAWLNFLPCLTVGIKAIALPVGLLAAWAFLGGATFMPRWALVIAVAASAIHLGVIAKLYFVAWQRSALVLGSFGARLWYMLRCNPVSLMVWWLMWLVPLWLGWRMHQRAQAAA